MLSCKKENIVNGVYNRPESIQFSISDFHPDSLHDSIVFQKVDAFLDELDSGSIQSDRSIEEGVWLLEAALNYSHGERDLVDIEDSKEINYQLSQDSVFQGNELHTIYQDLVTKCTDSDSILQSSNMAIGLIDLWLENGDLVGSVVRIGDRSTSSNGNSWMCHDAEVYVLSSDYNTQTGSYFNGFNCLNESPDGIGVNHILGKMVSAGVRGYGCPNEEYLHPCPFEENFIVSVSHQQINESAASSGVWSTTYPYRMPHSGVSNWNLMGICHIGYKVRGVVVDRLIPYVLSHCQSNHPGYDPIFFEAWRPQLASSNADNILKAQYHYGRCVWSGRPFDEDFAKP